MAEKSNEGHPSHLVRFGQTDLYVSRLCQGTAFRNMPRASDNPMGLRVLQHCIDVGVNFFDSSNAYGWGGAEETLGKAIAGRTRSGDHLYQSRCVIRARKRE